MPACPRTPSDLGQLGAVGNDDGDDLVASARHVLPDLELKAVAPMSGDGDDLPGAHAGLRLAGQGAAAARVGENPAHGAFGIAVEDHEVTGGAARHLHGEARADLDLVRGHGHPSSGPVACLGIRAPGYRPSTWPCGAGGPPGLTPAMVSRFGLGIARRDPLRLRHVLGDPLLEVGDGGVGPVGAVHGAAVAPADHADLDRFPGGALGEDRAAAVAVAGIGASLAVAGAEHGLARSPGEAQEGVAGAAVGNGDIGPEENLGEKLGVRLLVRRRAAS